VDETPRGASSADGADAPPLIGPARADDVPGMSHLLAQQLVEHHVEVDVVRLERSVRAVVDDPALGALLVARADGAVVGVAFLSWIHSLEHQGPSAWLDDVYVDPAHRGRGLGRSLVEAALTHARATGRAAIDLEVDADHASIARLYERMGFQRLPRERWQLTPTGDDA